MKKLALNILVSGLICAIAIGIYHYSLKSRSAYIDIKKVFNGFQMKKELEEKFKLTQKNREKILDSLSFNLKLLSKRLNEEAAAKKGIDKNLAYSFEYKREEFLKLKSRFEEDNAALSQKFDAQILERLTQYVIEYGKQNKYDFIHGTDGSGNLMYAKDMYNVSDEMISYINDKYRGVE